MFPLEYKKFESLANAALDYWVAGATVSYKPLKSGYSGAAVLKVDIRGKHTGKIENGLYILKLSEQSKWKDQDNEIIAYDRAFKWNLDFSKTHIPSLVASFDYFNAETDFKGYAMLYDIAGASLDAYMATDMGESSGFLTICERLMTDMLFRWVNLDPDGDKRPHELLEEWSGYRLDPLEAGSLHSFVKTEIGEDLTYSETGEVLINPLEFYKFSKTKQWSEQGYFKALLHGDLHGGNILINKFNPETEPYWIIDFGLSTEGGAGYDQAYLEVAQIIYCLGDRDPALLIGVLKQLDLDGAKGLLPPGTFWLKNCLEKMRASIFTWRDKVHYKRIDEINRQFSLARIAAGLNWANKPLPTNQRYLSLCYAGWAAREYVRKYEADDWEGLWTNNKSVAVASASSDIQATDAALWQELWETTKGFSARSGKYILIAEAQNDSSALRAIGQLPWSAVIDLDPYSDESGLHRHAAPVLRGYRSLHTFNDTIPITDFDRGTAWMMAAGWTMKNEPPTDYTNWLYDKLQSIRVFIKALENAVNPAPVFVIVMPGKTLDPSMPMIRVGKVIGAIDEMMRGRAKVLLLGRRELSEPIRHHHVSIDVDSFVHYVEKTFGWRVRSDTVQIPATNKQTNEKEWRSIPIDSLRTLQENLEILHSNVLNDVVNEAPENQPNSFWRGHPPTWADFHSGNDIERPLNTKLINMVREELDSSRNRTVVLYHNPGAGGTTAAYRAAWELHWDYPTAILRRWSLALGDRLQQLFNTSQKSVLLIADAADLSEAAREDLYRDLSQRNTRVVILYIRRVFGSESDHPLTLFDPMTTQEAHSFYKAFASQTEDIRRKQELARITEDDEFVRYRSPFFYGLITFEREFLAVDSYVTSHLRGIRGKARDVMEYLALLTIYSNTGMHTVLLRRLMGLSGDIEFALADLFDEGPVRLMTIRQERIRLMHQVIAEEVLSDLTGGGKDSWRLELHHLATELIRDVASCANTNSQIVLGMFRQIFTERVGGGIDGVEDRQDFAPIIEEIDSIDRSLGHQVLKKLTEYFPTDAHFWNHLGRHQIYRMRRDPEQAEQALQEAIRISPDDYIHYHTLGLVRRFRLRQILQGLKDENASKILEATATYFEGAVEAFEKTRSLNPDNIYGYITHVQIILEVIDYLKKASGVENIGQFDDSDQSTIEWLENQIAVAEKLLNDAQQLYGTLDQEGDSYITQCYADLEKLYGDFDRVIEIWELANIRGTSSPIGRRAIVNAYFARNARRWDTMQQSELKRIVDLTEDNLRSSGRRDEDYRFWFEAYKLLPEFDIEEAISKLRLWISHFPSWRGYYYLYIIHFYLWFGGRIDSTAEMEEALELCQKYLFGRRHISHQWLGYTPTYCPLVSAEAMGTWDKNIGFWKNEALLRPVNGIIDDPIQGPQAGWILIDGKVKAFFVPSKGDFYRNKDENSPVHFYIGFSPVGIRAWSVERGHVEGGNRVRYGLAEILRVPEFVSSPVVSNEAKLNNVTSLKKSRVLDFVKDFVKVKANLGADLTLAELEKHLEAVFRSDGLVKQMGFGSLEELLEQTGKYDLYDAGNEVFIQVKGSSSPQARSDISSRRPSRESLFGQITMLHDSRQYGFIEDKISGTRWFHKNYILPGHREKLKVKGQIVEFLPDTNEKGPIAVSIRVLDDSSTLTDDRTLIPKQNLGEAVKAAVLKILQDAMLAGEMVSLHSMEKRLSEKFKGVGTLASRLGFEHLFGYLRTINGIYIDGKYPNQQVRLSEPRIFGRLPVGNRVSREKLLTDVKVFTIKLVQEAAAKGQAVKVSLIGQFLNKEFPGPGKLAERLQYSTLLAFLSDVPELEVYGENPVDQYVRLAHQERQPRLALTEAHTEDWAEPNDKRLRDIKSLAIEFVQKSEGQEIKVTDLYSHLSREIPGRGSLAQRIGYKSFPAFLKAVSDLEVFGTPPLEFVRLRRKKDRPESHTIRPVSEIRKMQKDEILDEVKNFIMDIIQKTAELGGEIKVGTLATRLAQILPGQGKLAVRLGYQSFPTFLKEMSDLELYGENPHDLYVRLRPKKNKLEALTPTNIARKESLAPKRELVRMAQEFIIKTVTNATREGREVKVVRVAYDLAQVLPGAGKIGPRLGYPTFSLFLKSLPEVELYGDDAGNQLIRLKTIPLSSEVPTPNVSTVLDNKLTSDIKSLIIKLVHEAETTRQPLRLIDVASYLDKAVLGKGKLAPRLGYKTFQQFLDAITEIELYDMKSEKFLRLRSSAEIELPSEEAKSSQIATTESQPPNSNYSVLGNDLRDRAREIVVKIVADATAQEKKMSPLVLASIIAKKLPGEGPLSARLGYKTFTQFLESIPEIEINGIATRRHVQFRGDVSTT